MSGSSHARSFRLVLMPEHERKQLPEKEHDLQIVKELHFGERLKRGLRLFNAEGELETPLAVDYVVKLLKLGGCRRSGEDYARELLRTTLPEVGQANDTGNTVVPKHQGLKEEDEQGRYWLSELRLFRWNEEDERKLFELLYLSPSPLPGRPRFSLFSGWKAEKVKPEPNKTVTPKRPKGPPRAVGPPPGSEPDAANSTSKGPSGLQPVRKGGRHAYLLRIGGAIRRVGACEEEITNILLVLNDHECVPPKPRRDVERLARDIARRYRPKLQGPGE